MCHIIKKGSKISDQLTVIAKFRSINSWEFMTFDVMLSIALSFPCKIISWSNNPDISSELNKKHDIYRQSQKETGQTAEESKMFCPHLHALWIFEITLYKLSYYFPWELFIPPSWSCDRRVESCMMMVTLPHNDETWVGVQGEGIWIIWVCCVCNYKTKRCS